MELRAGVEPTIYSLQVSCLTIRLSKHKVELFRTSTNPIFYKWGYDLIYYCNYILAGHRGLEPRTHGLTVHRSADWANIPRVWRGFLPRRRTYIWQMYASAAVLPTAVKACGYSYSITKPIRFSPNTILWGIYNLCPTSWAVLSGISTHGWGGRIRTFELRDQNPLCYHFTTPH